MSSAATLPAGNGSVSSIRAPKVTPATRAALARAAWRASEAAKSTGKRTAGGK